MTIVVSPYVCSAEEDWSRRPGSDTARLALTQSDGCFVMTSKLLRVQVLSAESSNRVSMSEEEISDPQIACTLQNLGEETT